jgi:hypothetical protein
MASPVRTKPIDPDRDAFEAILGAHFMLERASGWCQRAVLASTLPGLLLWVHARRPLPGLAAWFVEVAWVATVILIAAFTAATVKWGRVLQAELPATRRYARLRFAAAPPAPSAVLLMMAVVPSVGLWLQAAAPAMLSPDVLAICDRSWLGLTLAGAGARAIEALQ